MKLYIYAKADTVGNLTEKFELFAQESLIYLYMPESLYFQGKWDGFCVNKERIRIFHFWHNKVPSWEVMLLKHLQGKYVAYIRNVRKLRSERSQAVVSGSGTTGHAIHLSNEPYIYSSGHRWQQA